MAATLRTSQLPFEDLRVLALGGAVAGLAFTTLLLHFEPAPARLAIVLAQAAWLLPIAWHDIQTRRAPNRVVYPALAFFVTSAFATGWNAAGISLLGGVAAFVVFLALAIGGRGAMGYGDVKVACLCGIAVGLSGVPALLILTSLAGAVVAGVLVLLHLRGRSDAIAFTPFLVGATFSYLAYRTFLVPS